MSSNATCIRGSLKACRHFAALTAWFVILMGPVHAQSAIEVASDQARIVKITGDASTVVVGNPMIADVTVREGQVVVHGRHFGLTNILVLGPSGEQLANLSVRVMRAGEESMIVYTAGARFSYVCAPTCESTLQPGDSPAYFDAVQKQINSKTSEAKSSSAQ